MMYARVLVLILALIWGFIFAECETLSTLEKTMYHSCRERYDCAREEYVLLQPPVVFHTCKVRYDCVRKEYTSIFPPVNTTLFTTLGVLIRVSIELSVLLFDVEKRIQFRESVADKFNVPLSMVSLMNVSSIGGFAGNGVQDEVELLQAYVKIGTASQEALASSDACMLVDCEQVHIYFSHSDLGSDFPNYSGARFLELPTCKLCAQEDELVFASSGTLDNPFSCKKECSPGFFQFKGLETSTCELHSQPQCSAGQFLLTGTPTSDSACVNCSSCEGMRFVEACLDDRDTVCESCPEPGDHQFYVGSDCTHACEENFVLDIRTKQCEFCKYARCNPGWRDPPPPEVKHNCSHCVSCSPLPANAHWSHRDDRFDCMWECDDHHEIKTVGIELGIDSEESFILTCVPVKIVVENIPVLHPVCAAGHFSLNFQCIECYEAAALGHVRQQDLPQPFYLNSRWEWIYGCKWRCLHSAGYWEIRPTIGVYWECVNSQMHSDFVRGIDLSWTSDTSTRRVDNSANESKKLVDIWFILVIVPLSVIFCFVVYNCVSLCSKRAKDQIDEEENIRLIKDI
jgi:hypothetical protein